MHFDDWLNLASFIHQRYTTSLVKGRFGYFDPSPAREAFAKQVGSKDLKTLEEYYQKMKWSGHDKDMPEEGEAEDGFELGRAGMLTEWFRALKAVASKDTTGAIWRRFNEYHTKEYNRAYPTQFEIPPGRFF